MNDPPWMLSDQPREIWTTLDRKAGLASTKVGIIDEEGDKSQPCFFARLVPAKTLPIVLTDTGTPSGNLR
ncbi:MAG: hypothetical protein K2Q17_16165 [Nitrospiraceae bacterium]|jgi:hypothetical protein|uniref:hypothetical protein n=1 Tax=Nitrospira cf. moscoviensis SBR1015 TaxID=96242 RepID=UPI000A0D3BBE|nr:hypothetical protein [Nitrospira cf. moscoviensis SBR1015]MBY0249195.1 hypothetical protein [Nitrospiraceae bacterium]OQW34381.1 MAG: hypothetical protein A4E20_11275 [Nitrospira sp. SG-bin2]